ncbi:hypothetical protein A0H81_06034 [Grifola frondosa]|uniref:F-box domain-containing protein n=1 Tax=Grifola frondosa TaxID=5627 RepID=A0A1C7MCC3_GRIFR|nr:hypothetical protein A0H81_06034 [Grifola frondosa]
MRMLRSRTSLEPDDDYMLSSASSTANNLCRSMTFHVDGNRTRAVLPHPEPAIRLYSHLDRAANAISSTLYMVDMLGYLPNLRHVAIEYVDWGFDDIFDQLRLMAFPDQVTRLDIKFSYSSASLLPLADGLREHYVRRWHPHWSTPHVRHLCISGAPMHFVADIVETCPGIETLELDCPARLEALAPLPSSVRTLVLRMPSGSVHRKSVEKWGLNAAVEAGLFFYPTRPRIVINSGPIEPSAWKEIQRLCKASSIQLVHRPYAHVATEAFCSS